MSLQLKYSNVVGSKRTEALIRSSRTRTQMRSGDHSLSFRVYTMQSQTLYYSPNTLNIIADVPLTEELLRQCLSEHPMDKYFECMRGMLLKNVISDVRSIYTTYALPVFDKRTSVSIGVSESPDDEYLLSVGIECIAKHYSQMPGEQKLDFKLLSRSAFASLLNVLKIIGSSTADIHQTQEMEAGVNYSDPITLRNYLSRSIQLSHPNIFALNSQNNEITLACKMPIENTRTIIPGIILTNMVRLQRMGIHIIEMSMITQSGMERLNFNIPPIRGIIPTSDVTRTFRMDKKIVFLLSDQARAYGGYFPTIHARIATDTGDIISGAIPYDRVADKLNSALDGRIFRVSHGYEGLFIMLDELKRYNANIDTLISDDLIALATREILVQLNAAMRNECDITINWIYKHKLRVTMYNTLRTHIDGLDIKNLSTITETKTVDWNKLIEEDESDILDRLMVLRLDKSAVQTQTGKTFPTISEATGANAAGVERKARYN